jgi:hypothetical protein
MLEGITYELIHQTMIFKSPTWGDHGAPLPAALFLHSSLALVFRVWRLQRVCIRHAPSPYKPCNLRRILRRVLHSDIA